MSWYSRFYDKVQIIDFLSLKVSRVSTLWCRAVRALAAYKIMMHIILEPQQGRSTQNPSTKWPPLLMSSPTRPTDILSDEPTYVIWQPQEETVRISVKRLDISLLPFKLLWSPHWVGRCPPTKTTPRRRLSQRRPKYRRPNYRRPNYIS